MYPTISDLLHDWFGFNLPLPIQSFGFFVAVSFIAAAYCFTKELKRKEDQGLLSTTTQKQTKGEPASVSELVIAGVFVF
jgi:phosphatidylglycerol:prolipoprotein diacylglycerol transferase